MTRWKWTLIVVALCGLCLSSCRSQKRPPPGAARPEPMPDSVPARTVPSMPPPGPARPVVAEMRGIWISDPRNLNWPRVMEELRGAGFNTLFVNFNTGGAAFHPSVVLPNIATRDEMRLCLDAARGAGIQVHAKFIVWYMFRSPPAYQKRLAREKRLLFAPNGGVLVQGEAPWLNPMHKINREERMAAIREALLNYAVDGVQLDYIRYPDNAGRITSGRIDLNTRFVADVRAEMKRIRPHLPLSVSNFYDYGRARNEMGQDWVTWAHRGYVDFLCPMNYSRDPALVEKWLLDQQRLVKGRVPIYCGLGAYMLASPQQLSSQITVARRAKAPGFVVFAYNEQFRQQILPGIRF